MADVSDKDIQTAVTNMYKMCFQSERKREHNEKWKIF